MNAQDYYQQLVARIGVVSSIVSSSIAFREIDATECYVKAILKFATGHTLQLAEYVVIVDEHIQRPKYCYQLLDAANKSVARWDNAAHHRGMVTFPHHRHDSTDRAHPSREMSPTDAITESLTLIEQRANLEGRAGS